MTQQAVSNFHYIDNFFTFEISPSVRFEPRPSGPHSNSSATRPMAEHHFSEYLTSTINLLPLLYRLNIESNPLFSRVASSLRQDVVIDIFSEGT